MWVLLKFQNSVNIPRSSSCATRSKGSVVFSPGIEIPYAMGNIATSRNTRHLSMTGL
ncbi:hypothetical protein DPMN_192434 [Dreissena polymorpha]|uniref:Uncharacterized protein n=1 Tax=Dreissena polymorpha TaxID=45954 RepID=A0A9D4BFM6_DREPO|nr:hypothetical protein DPMN_192434 [Dreissena polymorpha]